MSTNILTIELFDIHLSIWYIAPYHDQEGVVPKSTLLVLHKYVFAGPEECCLSSVCPAASTLLIPSITHI